MIWAKMCQFGLIFFFFFFVIASGDGLVMIIEGDCIKIGLSSLLTFAWIKRVANLPI